MMYMNYMNSTEYIFVQYVVCVSNEEDNKLVMNLTYDGAMDIIRAAGVSVREIYDESLLTDDDEDDCDY